MGEQLAMNGDAMLAQDLCARLCHDLVGPLGTVAGAIDLLGEEPEAGALAQDAALVLRRRLTFWRAACGAGTGPLALAEVAQLLEGMLAGGRASLALEDPGLAGADGARLTESTTWPAPVAQLLLVAAMLAGEALPRGGVVQLAALPGGGLRLWPQGRQAAWPDSLAAVLEERGQGGPREVLAQMLRRLAHHAGWQAALQALSPEAGGAAAVAALCLRPRTD